MPMHLKLQYHGYWHCQYDEVDNEVGDTGGIPHWNLSKTFVAVVWFNQSSERVACKKVAEKERHGPSGYHDRHNVHPDLETWYRKYVAEENQNGSLCHSQADCHKY